VGVGYSIDMINNEESHVGWILKLNKDGCFNDDARCPYLLNTGDFPSSTKTTIQSLQ